MNNLDKQYTDLLKTILEHGIDKKDRTGTGTKSIFGYTIRHNMKDGFPLLTTKKMPFKTIVTELLWFLRGDTNIKYLVDNNCHIWDGDAYKRYIMLPKKLSEVVSDGEKFNGRNLTKEEFINKIKTDDEFAEKWGELGPIYGKQWRKWAKFSEKVYTREIREVPEGGRFPETRNVNWVGGSEVVYIDQIANLINDLKTNPDSRRLMVNAWNVGELDQMVLPPCHYGFQVYTRELSLEERMDYYYSNILKNKDLEEKARKHTDEQKMQYLQVAGVGNNIPTRAISLMFNMRSVDTFLGLPFNIASYGLLLEIIAKEVNMVPDQLIGNLGDTHLYSNHIEQAKEQISREPMKLPTVHVRDGIFCSSVGDVILENYESHPSIKAPLSN
jgi:thymidylate synthase